MNRRASWWSVLGMVVGAGALSACGAGEVGPTKADPTRELPPTSLGDPGPIDRDDSGWPPTAVDPAAPADGMTAGDPTLGGGDEPAAPLPTSRGWTWVRTHPMFLSGLAVVLPGAPAAWVNDYFDGFGMNAAHLWATGLPDELASWQSARPDAPWVSWTNSDGLSHANGLVAGGVAADAPGRIGYQVGDEPRDATELAAMRAGAAALRAHDPNALLIINFMGDSVDLANECGATVDHDIFSYDRYSRGNDSYVSLATFRTAGLTYGRPYWRYMNAYMGADHTSEHSESDQRWDAFSGLVFGYTGHTWFIYQVGQSTDLFPIGFDANASFDAAKTPAWNMLAQINREMTNLGRAITQLVSTDVRFVPGMDLLLPDGVQKWSAGAGGDHYITALSGGDVFSQLLVGFFRDAAGSHYVMVQNVRHEHGKWPSDNGNSITARVTFDFTTAPAGSSRAQVLTLDKLDGQVKAKALAGSGNGRTLDVTLAAGDPVLFKYDDGRPFALGP